MKKLLAFILAAVMTASLCACGSSKGGAEGSTSAKGSSAAGEAVAASDIKVGCIMIGDENEGYTEAHLKAVEEMKKNNNRKRDNEMINLYKQMKVRNKEQQEMERAMRNAEE